MQTGRPPRNTPLDFWQTARSLNGQAGSLFLHFADAAPKDHEFMSRRSQAREAVLQMLYQADINPDVDPKAVRANFAEKFPKPELQEFAWKLFAGVMEMRADIDRRIEQTAQNWKLYRMAVTDRNALRLGVFELIHTDTPVRVVIDEAIELAKKFGSAQSAPFVNGILDKLVPEGRRQSSFGPASAAPAIDRPEEHETGADS
jgi:N utilization substance protein B